MITGPEKLDVPVLAARILIGIALIHTIKIGPAQLWYSCFIVKIIQTGQFFAENYKKRMTYDNRQC